MANFILKRLSDAFPTGWKIFEEKRVKKMHEERLDIVKENTKEDKRALAMVTESAGDTRTLSWTKVGWPIWRRLDPAYVRRAGWAILRDELRCEWVYDLYRTEILLKERSIGGNWRDFGYEIKPKNTYTQDSPAQYEWFANSVDAESRGRPEL